MSRSTIANRREPLFDKELELRAYDAAAINATTSETAIEVPLTKLMSYKAVVNVAAHSGYVADTAKWNLAIEVSDQPSSGFVTVGTVAPVGTAQQYEVAISGNQVESLKPGAKYARVTATKTGTPGTLTYGAFLATAH